MVLKDVTSFLCFMTFCVLQQCGQILAEYCGDEKYCSSPYKCCEASSLTCCLDRSSDDYYSRNFKLHVWNMWYFWFIIIFIMMSCFGGCGYYRRRRLMVMQQGRQCHLPATTQHLTIHPMQAGIREPPAFYAYTGPGAPPHPDMSNLPPPYYDVMTQPDLYPSNKAELPPYPGVPGVPVITADNPENPSVTTLSAGNFPAEVPQPPAYSETVDTAANQRPAEPMAAANRN
ncbi:uncharacterized protein LOC121382146 [Gigantopelta aegis]|uniref:uncharacterized protein LOC121382146 n=1 Tax=Gigantopelta aegis TaxID=1735272 RepID=UPI001B88ABA6|nr:uncharacterized protein LOC121382146 [Gigantopelta aegis]